MSTPHKKHMDTLVEQMNNLKEQGYTEDFTVDGNKLKTLNGKLYIPDDLVITNTYRFEGESNPSDSSDLFALEANDGTKGTLVAVRGAKHSKNTEVIAQIKVAE